MKRLSHAFLAISLMVPLFILSSCTGRLADFSIVSTKNYERGLDYRKVDRFEGKDKVLILMGIPLGTPTIEDAVDNAIEAGGGVYLANAVVRYGAWSVILVGEIGYTVEGDVYAPVSHGEIPDEEEETFALIETEDGLAMQSKLTGEATPVRNWEEVVQSLQ